MADILFMKHSKSNKPALLLPTITLIFMALFPLPGLTQDDMQTVSTKSIDSLTPRSGLMRFLSLDPVFFSFDKAILDKQAKMTLDRAAQYILTQPGVYRIIIEGHADSRNSEAYNYKLADLRAVTARDYLASRGVSDELFFISGLGENFPIDEHWTREGQRRNRRASIYIIEQR